MEEQKEAISEEKPEFQKKLEEMRAENERMEANIKELKEIKAFEALGGKSEGPPQEKPAVEETPQEYAKRVMAGKL